MQTTRVALIGDRDDSVLAHRAIPRALELAGARLARSVEWEWLHTTSIHPATVGTLGEFDCVWCVPASPYKSESGALDAIRYAREEGLPFLGTCGGCQHALLEYARNVLGIRNAEHAESHPDTPLPLIAPLACALVETTGAIHLAADTRIRRIYGRETIEEGYHCSFGLNPGLEHLLSGSALKISGRDAQGEARAFELVDRPFHLMAQFQPERSALKGILPPVVAAFIAAAAREPLS